MKRNERKSQEEKPEYMREEKPEEVVEERTKIETYWGRIWRRFKKNRLSRIGLLIIGFMFLLSIFAPFFSPYDHTETSMDRSHLPPYEINFIDQEGNFHFRPFTYGMEQSLDPDTWERIYEPDTSQKYSIRFFVRGWEYEFLGLFETDWHFFGVEEDSNFHLLGTDKLGRDMLSRIIFGSRVSIFVGLFGAFVTIIVGTTVGTISGFFGGAVDMLLQRLTEIIQMFPQLPLWMALSAAIPAEWPSTWVFMGIVLLFALITWTFLGREVRGKVLSYRDSEFVRAAEIMGASSPYLIIKHIIPNVLTHIIVVGTVTVPQLIIAESALSFLGLGIQPPMISWGVLLEDASSLEAIGQYPWLMIPGVFILLTVLGFNFLGDGLRDAVDPYSDEG